MSGKKTKKKVLTNCKISKQIDRLKKLQDQIQAQINELNDQLPQATVKYICPTCGYYNIWGQSFAATKQCRSCQQWFKDKVEMYTYPIYTYPIVDNSKLKPITTNSNEWVIIPSNTSTSDTSVSYGYTFVYNIGDTLDLKD